MKPNIFKLSALLSVVALLALALAGCGSKSDSASDPTAAVKDALNKTAGVTSGKVDLRGSIALGSMPGSIGISGDGVFDTQAEGGGAYDLSLALELAGTPQKFGLVAFEGKHYLVVGSKAVEQKGKGGIKLAPKDVAGFIKDIGENISEVKADGKNTYSASVDVQKLLAAEDKDGALGGITIPGLGSAKELSENLTSADLTVRIDADGYADSIDLNLPMTTQGKDGGLRVTIELTEINKPQTVKKPAEIVKDSSALGLMGSALSGD